MKINTDHNDNRHSTEHAQNTFDNVGMFAEKFDSPERAVWQKPDEVIASFNLPDTATVVDIGAGTGYFTVRLAQYLKSGKIIAFDQARKMVEYLAERSRALGLPNVDVRKIESGERLDLKEKVDLIFCVDVYHHLSDRVVFFSSLLEHLNMGGSVVIIDRTKDEVPEHLKGHRVAPEIAKEEMAEAGFTLSSESDLLLPCQYYLTFKSTT